MRFDGLLLAAACLLAAAPGALGVPQGAEEAPVPAPASPVVPAAAEPAAVAQQKDPVLVALVEEVERAEAFAETLAEFERRRAEASAAEREALDAASTRLAETSARLRVSEAAAEDVRNAYRSAVEQLGVARPALEAALDRLESTTDVPAFEPRFDTEDLELASVADRLDRLQQLRTENEAKRAQLVESERLTRLETVRRWGQVTERLNRLRTEAIDRLPEDARRELLGVSREGVAQLGREVEQLRLSFRLYRVQRLAQADEIPGRLADVFAVGSATWTLLKVLVVFTLFVMVRRRLPSLQTDAYRYARRVLVTESGRKRGEIAVRTLQVLAPWGSVLLLVAALRWSLGALAAHAEIDLPLRILTLYAVYRLSIDAIYAIALRIARRYRLSLDGGRAGELLRSVRTMMRVVVGIVVVLMLSEQLVGRGYLYHLVVRFAWVFVLAAALLLLARWRQPIADAYLDLHGDGRLAGLVRGSRERWYGVFVAAAAFVLLAGRALLRVARDFALGFEQTRRALAFMFRRRVEKRAEQRGYADGDLDALPAALVAAFEEHPLDAGEAAVPHFPGLDRLQRRIGPWSEDDTGASFLLVGEKGMGKTSWLSRIDPGALPFHRVTFTHRISGEDQLAATLIKGLELSIEPDAGMHGLRKALSGGPRRIVALDLLQNLYLGKVGGYDLFESFVSLVESTCDDVFWVCSISRFAWDHLSAVRPDLSVFRDVETLEAWTEEAIGTMLRDRTAAAGVRVVWDDLLADPLAARDPIHREEAEKQYVRLLWDYSDGNPRVALHFWLRSLVAAESGPLRVRLFRGPVSAGIERYGERTRFLLAAIVVHENLSLNEAAEATRYPRAVCRLLLQRLHDDGVLRRDRGRYRLTTHWHRAVVKFLKRGNLLSD